ncbi:hypothetical protein F5878DRAFT_247761 [Lentinula raphanica]|uniref:Uncharacterized protein n=1 Tax=Lentinula raphanica TaxID=153919 RepID=A0AA38UFZ9_9AGAR|nr:hypothetical protein EV360DRAFT_87279 [Lentinula raphanica]KAJ3836747.1 hypothetical protein F5878DRAFT_247761 [Lentinula raphanica]
MARSKNQVIKEGWGSRPNFQHSHGLKMSEHVPTASLVPVVAPEDIEEGNLILDAYMRQDDYNDDPNASHSQNSGEAQGGSGGAAKTANTGRSGARN